MRKVFISYSHKDSRYAHMLADHLKWNGIDIWIDDRIDYGAVWPRAIQESLDMSPVLIVIMSPDAYKSDWVQNEVSYAKAKRKIIFPILLRGDIWISLAANKHVDAHNEKMPPKEFIDYVKSMLKDEKSNQNAKKGFRVWDNFQKELGIDKESIQRDFFGDSSQSDKEMLRKNWDQKGWNDEEDNNGEK